MTKWRCQINNINGKFCFILFIKVSASILIMSLTKKFKHPSTFLIAGPTQCGKTTLVKNIIKHSDQIFEKKIQEIIYCVPTLKNFVIGFDKNVKIMVGLPDIDTFSDMTDRILVLDDLMTQQNGDFIDLFTRISHHNNVTVIYLTQNLFNSQKGSRDISLNAHCIVFFKNPRDRNQISYLSRQVFPENPRYVQESFEDATTKPHGYILFDLTQETGDNHRLRANILPTDTPYSIFYIPIKSSYKL